MLLYIPAQKAGGETSDFSFYKYFFKDYSLGWERKSKFCAFQVIHSNPLGCHEKLKGLCQEHEKVAL